MRPPRLFGWWTILVYMSEETEVCIVGAGLAGLACARRLNLAKTAFVLLEASDGAGGRVRTDSVDGFLLDRGFQVLQTAYPEAVRHFDYPALDLKPFRPGALVRTEGRFWTVGDPRRRPRDALASLRAPVGSPADKARVAKLLRRVRSASVTELLNRPETTTIEALAGSGFSRSMIERFFRPLFAGIQLDGELAASSRMFEFVFRMLADGDNAVPARGMGALPNQLVSGLPGGALRLNATVDAVTKGKVTLHDGAEILARAVVVAAEAPAATRLLGVPEPASRAVSCYYFAAGEPPVDEPLLVLNGEGEGPVNNLAVMSNVAPSYAPAGSALVSASVLEPPSPSRGMAVRGQLRGWFGAAVDTWQHLRTYDIAHAQPDQSPPFPTERPVKVSDGLYVAGDHRNTSSIHGALLAGRRAAEAVLADLR